MRVWIAIAAWGALMVASPALAQDRPVSFNIGGGFTATTGDVHDQFGSGFNFDAGLTFRVTDMVGFQGEYQYNYFGSKDVDLATNLPTDAPTRFEVNHRMHVGSFNLVLKPPTTGRVGGYAIVGPGVYNRVVELTTPSVGLIRVCNPWWYVCYPTAVPVDQVIGSRNSTDFGINVGGGVTFEIGDSASLYVEARYHYIWGPTVEDPSTGESFKANGTYFPITVGFRF
ncbi:MAG: porin family protein [Acidimicrobiia bacterium]|jgi:opacity protein-like surface antigen|nr:porin family protein [Acidimicrobiia bacterium]